VAKQKDGESTKATNGEIAPQEPSTKVTQREEPETRIHENKHEGNEV
jgi:hypothetical protein